MLDLDGLGSSLAETLVTNKIIKHPLELFELDEEKLANLELAPANLASGQISKPRRFGEKKAKKLIQSLIRAKELPLSKWLFAMGIHNFGESAANECSRLHKDLSEIINSQLIAKTIERWEICLLYTSPSPRD